MAADEIAALVADAMPYVTAAAGAYGGAVLAKTRDKAADATVGAGARILQRIFGHRKPGDPLPEPLAGVVAYPGDGEFLAVLAAAVSAALEPSAEMLADVRAIISQARETAVIQHAHAGRDAFTTGTGDIHVVHLPPPAVPRPPGPTVVGDVPQEPAAFQPRPGLAQALELQSGGVRVVFAVTGTRGVGKTQAAAACARRRIAERWRLVAWVDAESEATLLAGLALVAAAAGIGEPGADARDLAAGVRRWLEADGDRRLLVLDNADDPDTLRPYLPAAGAAQVIVTSNRRSAAGLGVLVPVEVFSEREALVYLAERTGLDDEAGARELACELGCLPLGLAQAAALITRQHLGYQTYLERLRSVLVSDYLQRVKGDAYPYRLAEAVELSLLAVENRDLSGVCARLMGLVAVLAETGVPRRWLHLAARTGVLGTGLTEADADAALGDLADASLSEFSVDGGTVTAHRLVTRVARERLAADGTLPAALDRAMTVLGHAADAIGEAWHDPAAVRDLAAQASAVTARRSAHPDVLTGPTPQELLEIRHLSVRLLLDLGDSTGLAIAAAEPLAADCERELGASHPHSLVSRNNLAMAYQAAGRTADAIPLLEQTLTDRERLLGVSHPDSLQSRNNLALAYEAAGRVADAIPLFEQTLADCEPMLGTGHPHTLSTRNNLAAAYQAAGRTADAILLLEQALADSERVLGASHPGALNSRSNLATAYRAAGRITDAIPLHEQALAGYEQIFGADNPNTLLSRSNLATAYCAAGRVADAIPLFEQTLSDRERLLSASHRDTLASRSNLAVAYLDAGRVADAIPLCEQALAGRERVLGASHPETLASRNNLASAYQAVGRTADAILLLERALADSERLLGASHPHILQTRSNLAMTYLGAGRVADAIPLLEQALADSERVLGVSHPGVLASRNNLALAYHDAGRVADAIPLFEQALAGRERLLGASHPETLASRNNLAAAYQAVGRTADAIPLHEQTIANYERLLGTSHPDALTSRNNLALAYEAAGRAADAIPLLEQALADSERVLGTGHSRTQLVRRNLASVKQQASGQ